MVLHDRIVSSRATLPPQARVALAWRRNLSKTRAAMYQSSRGSSAGSPGNCAGKNTGRGASRGLFLAVTLGVLAACDSDDSSPPAAVGGSSGQPTAVADAGNPLRGEGFEPTPTFDITNPDREPPSRNDVIEGVLNLGVGGGTGNPQSPSDAGSPDAGGDAS